jgi:hypothetical protein
MQVGNWGFLQKLSEARGYEVAPFRRQFWGKRLGVRRDRLSFLMRMATITAPVRFANIRNDGLGVVMLDLERSNQRILGLYLSSV